MCADVELYMTYHHVCCLSRALMAKSNVPFIDYDITCVLPTIQYVWKFTEIKMFTVCKSRITLWYKIG